MQKYTYFIYILIYLLNAIGTFGVFGKCGIKRFFAFIPLCREYHIGIAADREKDGRIFCASTVISYVLIIVRKGILPIAGQGPFMGLLYTLLITALLVQFVYMFRIYKGLVEVFKVSKLWIIFFVFFEAIAMLCFGYIPSFVPSKKATYKNDKKGPAESGWISPPIDNGITININERSVREFIRKKILLKDIHLSIPRGRMVLLLGGSGAGKTTFVNAVIGYEKANATVLLDNRNMYSDYSNMKYDVGFVPQQDLMRGSDTVEKTLLDAADMRLSKKISKKEKKKRVQEALEELGIYKVRSSPVSKLSGGQRKRLSIAIEYIAGPGLFILDEPDSGLDGVVARSLFSKLRTIADKGKIIVAITHTPDRVADLFDDVIVLAKDSTGCGRLAFYGSIDEAKRFFEKDSIEGILYAINQVDEGGEGLSNEYIEKYNASRK